MGIVAQRPPRRQPRRRKKSEFFPPKTLTNPAPAAIIFKQPQARQTRGGVAHLGERLNGIQEVRGSIPLISTKKPVSERMRAFFAAQNKQFLLFLLKCLQADAETGMMKLYIPDNGLCTRNTEKGANDEKASG